MSDIDIRIPPKVRQEWEDSILRGMDFLDSYFGGPDWVTRLDIDALELNNTTTCVCGQLFEEDGQRTVNRWGDPQTGYDYAVKYVLEHGVPSDEVEEPSVYLGFNLKDDGENEEDLIAKFNGFKDYQHMLEEADFTAWDLFTEMWTTFLEKRKADLGVMLDG